MKREKIIKGISLPDGVNAAINNNILVVKGPKGEVKKEIKQQRISIKVENGKIIIEAENRKKDGKKIIGSLTAHINNMIKGSVQNHIYTLKICSGHFPMNVSLSGNKMAVKNFLGEKVPRTLDLKEGADVRIEGDLIYVTSLYKETAGQVAADIEQLTRRPGYDLRVFQDGVYIINKDGKELK